MACLVMIRTGMLEDLGSDDNADLFVFSIHRSRSAIDHWCHDIGFRNLRDSFCIHTEVQRATGSTWGLSLARHVTLLVARLRVRRS